MRKDLWMGGTPFGREIVLSDGAVDREASSISGCLDSSVTKDCSTLARL